MDMSSPHNYYFSVLAFKRWHLAFFFQKGLPSTSLLFPQLAKTKGLLELTILENMQPTSSTKFHTLAFPRSLNWSKPPPSCMLSFLHDSPGFLPTSFLHSSSSFSDRFSQRPLYPSLWWRKPAPCCFPTENPFFFLINANPAFLERHHKSSAAPRIFFSLPSCFQIHTVSCSSRKASFFNEFCLFI